MTDQIQMELSYDDLSRMKELIQILQEASRAYYQEAREIMPNLEYDRLYDELKALEEKTGTVMANSPTVSVGYEVLSSLPKEKHPSRMLSLDKTKDREQLASWLGDQEGVMSWKLDGLTIVLTYEGGVLTKAVTRGNGDVGEVITANARMFENVPYTIDFKGRLVLRGEAVITYKDFEEINESISAAGEKYKNPRNLCSGSVRQLDPSITKSRHVRFFAFALVEKSQETGKGDFEMKSRTDEFNWLKSIGFDVVEHVIVPSGKDVPSTVESFSKKIETNPVPSDGLVLSYNDIKYGKSLGVTAKFPRDSIAFKWQDEEAETTLKEIEWSASRTGLINPVAVFDPVELEGTTVSRASVHNISVMQDLGLGIGDRITVYKANMIIPQIGENLTRSLNVEIPSVCPVCGEPTRINDENGVKTLFCDNPECAAKKIKSFDLFASRNAMNIDGLSEQTLEKFISKGFIHEFSDLFRLSKHRDTIVSMEGFGELSFNNLKKACDDARKVNPERLLYALGIPGFGRANTKLIAGYAKNDWAKIKSLSFDELITIDGIGDIMASDYTDYFGNGKNLEMLSRLERELEIDESYEESGESLSGLTFVITGSLNNFVNRDELKAKIEAEGGKVSGSVSKNTSYLINNDISSGSGKNKTAKELGIPIISEEEFMERFKFK